MPHLSYKTLGKIALELFKKGDKKTLFYLTKNQHIVSKSLSTSICQESLPQLPAPTRRSKSLNINSSRCKNIFNDIQNHLSQNLIVLDSKIQLETASIQPVNPIQQIQQQFTEISIYLKELLNTIINQSQQFKNDLDHLINVIETSNNSTIEEDSPSFPTKYFKSTLSDLKIFKVDLPLDLLERTAIGYAGICSLKALNLKKGQDVHSIAKDSTLAECLYAYEQLVENELIQDLLETIPQNKLIQDFISRYQ